MDKVEKPLVIFGINPVLEKLKSSPKQIFELMIVKGRERTALTSVVEEAARQGLPVRYTDNEVLNRLADGNNHQGVVAAIAAYVYGAFDELLGELSSGAERILILDGLTDPGNFGALLRSAEGAGIRHVIIPKDRSVGVTTAVIKRSSGAAHYLKIYRVPNLMRALQAIKQAGIWVVGLDAAAQESLYERVFPDRVAVVLGSEGKGIRPIIRRECDFLVSIPMLGRVASLNVAVAGGIFLYELVRQGRQR